MDYTYDCSSYQLAVVLFKGLMFDVQCLRFNGECSKFNV